MAGKPQAAADGGLDITDSVCPETTVRIKEALDALSIGQALSIRLNDGEPAQNTPKFLKEEGQRVLKLTDNLDGTWQLLVRKDSD
jgi:TusA-related sulfurtransferase